MKNLVPSSLLVRFVSTFALASLAAMAADWPQWRGPNHDGISAETGLLKSWPAGGPPLAWRATGIGAGFSSVAVVGDRIYTMGDQADSSHTYALNKADGKIIWSTKIGKPGAPGWGGFTGTRGTPTVANGLVFVIDKYDEVVCLNAADGKEKWRKSMKDDFGAKMPEWGFSESPLADGELVIFTPGGMQGTVVALNQKDGKVAWRCAEFKDAAHYSSLIVAEIGGVRQYIQLTDASVAGIRAKDGALLWKAPRPGKTAVIPTPIYADNHVYVSSGYGVGCNLFKITQEGDSFKASEVYNNKLMVNHHGGVVKLGANLYGHSDGKGWVCQNFLTGESVWSEKAQLGKGAVTYADGRLYCVAEDQRGTVALLEASPAGYKETGRFDPPDRSGKQNWAHPVVSGGKLYLRDQDLLLCYDVKAK